MKTLDDLKREVIGQLDRHAMGPIMADEAKWVNAAIDHLHAQGHLQLWQPIETAPKHERILMLMKHGAIEGTWGGEIGYGYYWRDINWYPSHWMPLPKSPEETK